MVVRVSRSICVGEGERVCQVLIKRVHDAVGERTLKSVGLAPRHKAARFVKGAYVGHCSISRFLWQTHTTLCLLMQLQ